MTIKTRHVQTAIAALATGVFAMSPVMAQTMAPPPAGSKQVIPEKQGGALQNGRSDSLSKKLSTSSGVIKPNGNVDPGMSEGAPKSELHTMPVIPPSATGGGNAK